MPPLDPKNISILKKLTGLKKLEEDADTKAGKPSPAGSAGKTGGSRGPFREEKQAEKKEGPQGAYDTRRPAGAPATTGSDLFYNPYHFIPAFKPDKEGKGIRLEDFKDETKKGYYTHSKYVEDAYCCGRLICRLTNEDPVFIGGKRIKNAATGKNEPKIPHFELDNRPAIPASSLRGLLSSIAEAASNSSLRVLNDGILSFRKKMTPAETLSALGMVVIKDGKHCLRPLSMPTLSGNQKNGYTLDSNYKDIFKEPRLKVHVGDYNNTADKFLNGKETFTPAKEDYYYLKLKKDWRFDANGVLSSNEFLHFPSSKKGKNTGFAVGQLSGNNRPITKDEYEEIKDHSEKENYVRGILRVLGKEGRDIPHNKKHELFIPYPEGAENWDLIEIPNEVIRRFNLLADERTLATKKKKSQLPYEPVGTVRNDGKKKDDMNLRLKDGDIVYFRADNKVIAEVSFSSIWRDFVKDRSGGPATVHSFFKEIDGELLPFNKDRKWLSPAELLFGFVQENNKKEKDDKKEGAGGIALAGRVRVSFGKLKEDAQGPFYGEEITLKILGSPKPPCPSMYFKNKTNRSGFIHKSALNLDKHEPQGRKAYLHRFAGGHKEPWRTQLEKPDFEQQVQVAPLEKHEFYFHIDFNNLSEWELGLLCYAIRPSDAFRHKIGMGKSIGLGKVRIDPLGIFFIDRKARYETDALSGSPRYHSAWIAENNNPESWPQAYKTEKEYSVMKEKKKSEKAFEEIRDDFKNTMDKKTMNALELLGDPGKVKHPVHTPQLHASQLKGKKPEEETFSWFVLNEKGSLKIKPDIEISVRQQTLEPLDGNNAEFALRKHPLRRDDCIFFLGGQDLEMSVIRSLLEGFSCGFFDKKLRWGAKASAYRAEIEECLSEGKTPVFIEMENDIALSDAVFIDHHGEGAGAKKSSLRQVFDLLGLKEAKKSRWLELVDANDRGYIPAMLEANASLKEISMVREADRKAQGITAKEEKEGEEAVKAAKTFAGGALTVVSLPHSRCATVTDRMEEALGGKRYSNLLVISPEEVNFYGSGEVVLALAREFPGGWCGGMLPKRGFWGHGQQLPNVMPFLINFLKNA